jgi:hypothetical protein
MQMVGLLGAKLNRTSAAHVDSPEQADSLPVSVILSNGNQKERSLESFLSAAILSSQNFQEKDGLSFIAICLP